MRFTVLPDYMQFNSYVATVEQKLDGYSIPEPMSGCHLWIGSKSVDGYGRMEIKGKTYSAHRVSWELRRGPIPNDKKIDHICRNTSCINVDHLRVVTHQENMANRPEVIRNKTHCARGHAYDEVGFYLSKRGQRHCRPCKIAREAERYAKNRESILLDQREARRLQKKAA